MSDVTVGGKMTNTSVAAAAAAAGTNDIKSVKPYATQDEYLYAMKEDLAEWLNILYELSIGVDDFFEHIETGVILCRHANALQELINEKHQDIQQQQQEKPQLPQEPESCCADCQTWRDKSNGSDRVKTCSNMQAALADCANSKELEIAASEKHCPSKHSLPNHHSDDINKNHFCLQSAFTVALFGNCDSTKTRTALKPSLNESRSSSDLAKEFHLSPVPCKLKALPGTFQARDNVSNFITWCRRGISIPDSLLFETEDLVGRKNERNVVLCLLEVARRGARWGMLAPQLVQFEAEIEAEMSKDESATEASVSCVVGSGADSATTPPSPSASDNVFPGDAERANQAARAATKKHVAIRVDMMSLDEMVRLILKECTCPDQFPMIRVSEGKYMIGDSLTLIFLRILRNHVMVRIGGGWDTLESYLDRHDPCRCNSKAHRGTRAFSYFASTDKTSPPHRTSSSSEPTMEDTAASETNVIPFTEAAQSSNRKDVALPARKSSPQKILSTSSDSVRHSKLASFEAKTCHKPQGSVIGIVTRRPSTPAVKSSDLVTGPVEQTGGREKENCLGPTRSTGTLNNQGIKKELAPKAGREGANVKYDSMKCQNQLSLGGSIRFKSTGDLVPKSCSSVVSVVNERTNIKQTTPQETVNSGTNRIKQIQKSSMKNSEMTKKCESRQSSSSNSLLSKDHNSSPRDIPKEKEPAQRSRSQNRSATSSASSKMIRSQSVGGVVDARAGRSSRPTAPRLAPRDRSPSFSGERHRMAADQLSHSPRLSTCTSDETSVSRSANRNSPVEAWIEKPNVVLSKATGASVNRGVELKKTATSDNYTAGAAALKQRLAAAVSRTTAGKQRNFTPDKILPSFHLPMPNKPTQNSGSFDDTTTPSVTNESLMQHNNADAHIANESIRNDRGDTEETVPAAWVSRNRLKRSASLQATHSWDLLEAPPEDVDLNARMELLFEEYRKVELGLIFCKSDTESDKTDGDNAKTSEAEKTSKGRRTSTGAAVLSHVSRSQSIPHSARADIVIKSRNVSTKYETGVKEAESAQMRNRRLSESELQVARRLQQHLASASLNISAGKAVHVSRNPANRPSTPAVNRRSRETEHDSTATPCFSLPSKSAPTSIAPNSPLTRKSTSESKQDKNASSNSSSSLHRQPFSAGEAILLQKTDKNKFQYRSAGDLVGRTERPLTLSVASSSHGKSMTVLRSSALNLSGMRGVKSDASAVAAPASSRSRVAKTDISATDKDFVEAVRTELSPRSVKPRKDDRFKQGSQPPTRIPKPASSPAGNAEENLRRDRALVHGTDSGYGELKRFDSGVDISANLSPSVDNCSVHEGEDNLSAPCQASGRLYDVSDDVTVTCTASGAWDGVKGSEFAVTQQKLAAAVAHDVTDNLVVRAEHEEYY